VDSTQKTLSFPRKSEFYWEEKNREHSSYLKSRSSARSFIKNKATLEDLEELKELILSREKLIETSKQD
jgi:hypothetical protein